MHQLHHRASTRTHYPTAQAHARTFIPICALSCGKVTQSVNAGEKRLLGTPVTGGLEVGIREAWHCWESKVGRRGEDEAGS